MIYTLTFNPALDYVVHLEQFALGATNRTTREVLQAGGKGLNVATVLHNLGESCVALGFLAGFTGDVILSDMRQRGVSADFIILPEGMTRINVKMKMGVETEINGVGPDIDLGSLQTLYGKLDRLGSGDILIISGSTPRGTHDDVYERIVDRLTGRGVEFVVDADGALLEHVLPYHPFLIKPNHEELGVLCHRKLETWDYGTIATCAEELQARGARNVLVSMAADGALLLTEDKKVLFQPAAKGEVHNSVGAGDSMIAGFLAGWRRTGDFAQALLLGTAAGGATAFSEGLCTKEEMETVLEQLKG